LLLLISGCAKKVTTSAKIRELSADATNTRALKCYRKVGFVEEGRRRKRFWRVGEYRDVVEMATLEDEWVGTSRQGSLLQSTT
jgi:ribosomal protein S18 acetylase RimI-like enzyme